MISTILKVIQLSHLVAENKLSPAPLPAAKGVSLDGVIQWQQLPRLISCETIQTYSTEIQCIEGLGASKSDLFAFNDLDELVEKNSPEMIDDISIGGLAKNLSHSEIRITRPAGSDSFVKYSWDERLFLSNTGGSHHFSAARYIASRIGREVPLCGKLRYYYINNDILSELLSGNRLYLLEGIDSRRLFGYDNFQVASLQLTPGRDYFAVLLPINIKTKVIQHFLDRAGFIDLGKYLRTIAH